MSKETMLKEVINMFRAKYRVETIVYDPVLYPHEKYPELLDWRAGDKLRQELLCKIRFDYTPYFVKFDEKYIYLQDSLKKEAAYFPIDDVMRDYENVSLRTRMTESKMKETSEYEILLSEFQSSIEELKLKHK